MSDLVRALLVAGLMSGTQPVTLMGLLIVMSGRHPRRNGWAFLGGVFAVETVILLLAALFLGGSVSAGSIPGLGLLWVRLLIGVLLIIAGVRLRRPPQKPSPETPKALEKLQGISAFKAFVGGVLVADYVGPMIAASAISTAEVARSDRLLAVLGFLSLAIGIPMIILLVSTSSDTAHRKLDDSTRWVMRNRRQLASWFGIIIGTLLLGDAAIALLLI